MPNFGSVSGKSRPRPGATSSASRCWPSVCGSNPTPCARSWTSSAVSAGCGEPVIGARIGGIAEKVAAEHPEGLLTVGNFREAAGIGRNMTMPVLEHFDAVGFTTRIHEGRRIGGDRRAIFFGRG